MRNFYLKISIVIVAAGLLVFLIVIGNSWLYNRYKDIQQFRIATFSKLSIVGSFISELDKMKDLTEENLSLKDENRKLLSQLALQAEFKDQNDFLRKTASLGSIPNYKFIDARTFNLQFTPEGHYLLINKGENDKIQTGDVVISSSGVLLGQVTDTFRNSSRVGLVTNPGIKVTIKLVAKNTIGISNGALGDGILMDFVSQNDDIAEGDTVVTNGNDLFPPGLIVGVINKITSDDGNLFKKVLINAEFKNINIDRILILSR